MPWSAWTTKSPGETSARKRERCVVRWRNVRRRFTKPNSSRSVVSEAIPSAVCTAQPSGSEPWSSESVPRAGRAGTAPSTAARTPSSASTSTYRCACCVTTAIRSPRAIWRAWSRAASASRPAYASAVLKGRRKAFASLPVTQRPNSTRCPRPSIAAFSRSRGSCGNGARASSSPRPASSRRRSSASSSRSAIAASIASRSSRMTSAPAGRWSNTVDSTASGPYSDGWTRSPARRACSASWAARPFASSRRPARRSSSSRVGNHSRAGPMPTSSSVSTVRWLSRSNARSDSTSGPKNSTRTGRAVPGG